jgi:hypothetical protein
VLLLLGHLQRNFAFVVLQVLVRSVLEQETHLSGVAFLRGQVQRGLAVLILRVDLGPVQDEIGARHHRTAQDGLVYGTAASVLQIDPLLVGPQSQRFAHHRQVVRRGGFVQQQVRVELVDVFFLDRVLAFAPRRFLVAAQIDRSVQGLLVQIPEQEYARAFLVRGVGLRRLVAALAGFRDPVPRHILVRFEHRFVPLLRVVAAARSPSDLAHAPLPNLHQTGPGSPLLRVEVWEILHEFFCPRISP